ncbi:MAG: hypothetical protein D6735_09635, partial [Acidobacteria bacterium]
MTRWILYDHLTWPEVAALPRHCPLVLPLGKGYDREQLAEALSFPEQIAILPAFPFGWRSSGIPVPEGVLKEVLWNLLNSLRDDGFSNVFLLTP